jgi:hypothetical protein
MLEKVFACQQNQKQWPIKVFEYLPENACLNFFFTCLKKFLQEHYFVKISANNKPLK